MLVRDTICALATPPGVGGLAVIRLSGPDSFTIADLCFRGSRLLAEVDSHTIHYGKFYDAEQALVDTITASVFRAPHSYTGENTVEFSCHGGLIVSQELSAALIAAGARPAEPGEFTKRAFLNNKLDLTQAEAVADIIHSVSQQGTHAAARQLLGGLTRRLRELRSSLVEICGLLELELDFSMEDIEFIDRKELRAKLVSALAFCKELTDSFQASEIMRSGYNVGIVGYPNAGKSSLLNAMLNKKRAIVSPTPGTTRDYIEEHLVIGGTMINIFDTAGLRSSEDRIEIEGIQLAQTLLRQCNLLLILNDSTLSFDHSQALVERLQQDFPSATCVLVQNKIDLLDEQSVAYIASSLCISAVTTDGIDAVKALIAEYARRDMAHAGSLMINARHVALLQMVIQSLHNALEALETAPSNEFIAIDVREALRKIGEITGDTWSENVLDEVFARFCIGK